MRDIDEYLTGTLFLVEQSEKIHLEDVYDDSNPYAEADSPMWIAIFNTRSQTKNAESCVSTHHHASLAQETCPFTHDQIFTARQKYKLYNVLRHKIGAMGSDFKLEAHGILVRTSPLDVSVQIVRP